jgi:hypothetical protein
MIGKKNDLVVVVGWLDSRLQHGMMVADNCKDAVKAFFVILAFPVLIAFILVGCISMYLEKRKDKVRFN